MADIPRCAMEEVTHPDRPDTYRPVEAPPCGARLDIDHRGVHLVCDQLPDHQAHHYTHPDYKHRAVIDADAGYALWWCWDDCAHRCDHMLANCLKDIRELIREERGG